MQKQTKNHPLLHNCNNTGQLGLQNYLKILFFSLIIL